MVLQNLSNKLDGPGVEGLNILVLLLETEGSTRRNYRVVDDITDRVSGLFTFGNI